MLLECGNRFHGRSSTRRSAETAITGAVRPPSPPGSSRPAWWHSAIARLQRPCPTRWRPPTMVRRRWRGQYLALAARWGWRPSHGTRDLRASSVGAEASRRHPGRNRQRLWPAEQFTNRVQFRANFESELQGAGLLKPARPRRPRESVATEIEDDATGRPLMTKGEEHGNRSSEATVRSIAEAARRPC